MSAPLKLRRSARTPACIWRLGPAHAYVACIHHADDGWDRSLQMVLPRITLHTTRCRVTYYSLLLRSDPSEHVRLAKQVSR